MITLDVGAATLTCLVDGPEDGPVVLMAHGFPDCARSFRLQVEPLVARGYRVVRPYLRGYAPSSTARDGRYDAEALAADLCAVALRVSSSPVALVGHDWGAIAAYAAVAMAPHLFSRLVTVAVPHLGVAAPRFASARQLRRSAYIGLFQLPGIAEHALSRDGFALVDRLWRTWSPGFRAPAEELAHVKAAFAEPAHLAAVLGYYRALRTPRALAGEPRRLLFARVAVPALYVHGIDDGCVGVEVTEGLEPAYARGVTIHRIAGGHFVHQENPETFNRLLSGFLSDSR